MDNNTVIDKIGSSNKPNNWMTFLKKMHKPNHSSMNKVHSCMVSKHSVLVHKTLVMTNTILLVFFTSNIFIFDLASAGGIGDALADDISVMDDVEVTGTRESSDRAYSKENGKRFITNPYGETKSILAVASEIKAKGKLKRVSTRGMKMPQGYVGRYINRYKHTFDSGNTFSYYEGEGFGALGFHLGEGRIVLDVLDGGGPFSAPKLWGPYDQVLGDKGNSSMELMMADGNKDGMGLLKASYAIGYTAVMAEEDYSSIGNDYGNAINDAVTNMGK